MTLLTLIKQWNMGWTQPDPLATFELEERRALAHDLGLTDTILARLAALGPERAADLPAILEAVFTRLA